MGLVLFFSSFVEIFLITVQLTYDNSMVLHIQAGLCHQEGGSLCPFVSFELRTMIMYQPLQFKQIDTS